MQNLLSPKILAATAALSFVLSVKAAFCQTPTPAPSATPRAFTQSSSIAPLPLPDERRSLLMSLPTLPLGHAAIDRARKRLCADMMKPPGPAAQVAPAALAVTESDMSLEISFEKEPSDSTSPAPKFSAFIDLRDNDVLVRTSLPRFPSESGGILVSPEIRANRTIWIEGKQGTNLLAIILPLGQCGTKAVALCPRTFSGSEGLKLSGYTPRGVQYFVTAKADGLFATEGSAPGRIRASILGNIGVPIPERWFDEQLSGANPSATMKLSVLPERTGSLNFTPITLPFVGAIESRLELGRGDELLRTIYERTSIELTEFQLPEKHKVEIRLAEVPIEAGSCYLVTKWSEGQL